MNIGRWSIVVGRSLDRAEAGASPTLAEWSADCGCEHQSSLRDFNHYLSLLPGAEAPGYWRLSPPGLVLALFLRGVEIVILSAPDGTISALCLWARLPESWRALACRLRAMRLRSCRLIPVRAVCGGLGLLRLRPCVRSVFPVRRPRQFRLPVGGLRFRGRLPGAAICQRLLRAPRSSPGPRVILLLRSRRC